MKTPTGRTDAPNGAAPILGRMLGGAAIGAGLGGLFLGVGLVRLLLAWVGGAHVRGPSADDLQWVSAYVGGFAGAGALVGLLKPLRRTRPGAIAVGVLAAAVVGIAVSLISEQVQPVLPPSIDWGFVVFFTLVFGTVAGLKLFWRPPSE